MRFIEKKKKIKKFKKSESENDLSELDKILLKYNIKKNTAHENQEDGHIIEIELKDKLEENLIDK